MVEAERPLRVFFGFDRAFFGDFADFASIPAENAAFIHHRPETLPRDEAVVRAHMSLATLKAAYPHGRFMTVLREPVCRLLSHFAFWRGFTPEQDAAWGNWAVRSGIARLSLERFLAAPEIACQTDNVATRLLLYPHRLIPAGAPIDPAHDAQLTEAALDRLAVFDFAAALEAPDFGAALSAFLGATPAAARHNITPATPPALRTALDRELTDRALGLLEARSRLDLALWRALLPLGVDADQVRHAALMRGVARVAGLLGSAG
jgi:hypothetical protein